MRYFLYIVIVAVLALNTFFGLGPVLMADGSIQERMITFGIVLIIYIFSMVVLVKIRKSKGKSKFK